jgi:transcriptional regulator
MTTAGAKRMYIPKHFEESRIEVLHQLIRAHPMAALVTLTSDGLDANHIPLEIDPEPAPFGTLRGHVARANPLWRDPGSQALAIFQGPNTYISPSWYVTKQETGKVVPTWNYAVVHAHGCLRAVDDKNWLRAFVERLTNRHESGRRNPWKVTDAPADYIDGLLDTIVGLEMPITRLVGKWKVSQNRPERDREAVAGVLQQEGTDVTTAMATLVTEAGRERQR